MSHPHDDDAPVEHDPTGMRALLAGLPDPGPMPEDLVERITAALAAEAGAAGIAATGTGATGAGAAPAGPGSPSMSSPVSSPASGPPAEDEGARVLPLRRRPRARHLAVAAAVVGAMGLGGVALQVTQGGLTAAFDANGGADSGAGRAESQAGGDAGTDTSGGSAALAPAAGSGEVLVVTSGQSYESADLAPAARRLVDGSAAPLRELAAEAPGIGPLGTPLGARSCADALGIPATAGLLVDLAEVDGAPAAVVVATAETGRTVWAVDRACTTGTTGPISGPVSLD
ncbi:hypothetical protein ACK8HX_05285 [Oryzobacter sp. R7]|uniref:hypothetical protein n=1 Tax=Oryzobacter faecalis TaxID=3388656 RepID=UPI00398CF242